MIEINKSPILTSKNYGVNSFEFDENLMLKQKKEFDERQFKCDTISQNLNSLQTSNTSVAVDYEQKQFNNFAKKIVLEKSFDKPINICFECKKDDCLVDNLLIETRENVSANIVLKYNKNENVYHNGTLKIVAGEASNLEITLFSNMASAVANLFSIEVISGKDSNVLFNIIDIASQNSIQNIKVSLNFDNAKFKLNSLYFGNEGSRLSLNYFADIFGNNCDALIDANGMLSGDAFKNFVGTIKFNKGAKNSLGQENENCFCLSNNAVAKSTPILLSREETAFGEHSSSIAKIDRDELFYVKSRGLDDITAKKLLVKSKFNNSIKNLPDEIKLEVLNYIDRGLV